MSYSSSKAIGGGGDGSDATGIASDGGPHGVAGGGGGGAGRIRINTLTDSENFGGLLPNMASGLATVGQVRVE